MKYFFFLFLFKIIIFFKQVLKCLKYKEINLKNIWNKINLEINDVQLLNIDLELT